MISMPNSETEETSLPPLVAVKDGEEKVPDEKRLRPSHEDTAEGILVSRDTVDVACEAVKEDVPERFVGEYAGYVKDEDGVLTHLFTCLHPGYRGWYWAVSVLHVEGCEYATINEVGMAPGDQALLAPRWVPLRERIEEVKAEKRAEHEAEMEQRKKARGGRKRRRTTRFVGGAEHVRPRKKKIRQRAFVLDKGLAFIGRGQRLRAQRVAEVARVRMAHEFEASAQGGRASSMWKVNRSRSMGMRCLSRRYKTVNL